MSDNFIRYCPQCRRAAPPEYRGAICVPCANTGHGYRLVQSEADRQLRIAIWGSFWLGHGIKLDEIVDVPGWYNLLFPVTTEEAAVQWQDKMVYRD